MIEELNSRSREIFREIVENYLATGELVGSRTLSKRLGAQLSAATIRNVMSDLEEKGLLSAPHKSAGRMPTDIGLRLFVDGLLEIGDVPADERQEIEALCAAAGKNLEDVLTEATQALSGLTHGAGLVVAPKIDRAIRQIEFVSLDLAQVLVVIVHEDGTIENRVMSATPGLTPSALTEASNYLNSRLKGRTLESARLQVLAEIAAHRAELDELTARVVEAGLATSTGGQDEPLLIVSGRANLLEDVHATKDLERIRLLFEDIERQKELSSLLDLAQDADGVRIFIGAENELFSLSGSSLILSPYMNARHDIVGIIGVIGPTRVNYGRIIPMVDYTAQVISRFIG